MIITVTTNPSIDRTVAVDALALGGVNRGDLSAIDPGGKGVNVSRALSAYGAKDRKSTRLNSSHIPLSRMPSSA